MLGKKEDNTDFGTRGFLENIGIAVKDFVGVLWNMFSPTEIITDSLSDHVIIHNNILYV